MKYAVDSMRMKKMDEYTINNANIPAMELMERAANKLVTVMQRTITKEDRILVVCGPGNNGGDGVATGRILFLQGFSVAISFVGEESKCSIQMKAQLDMVKNLGIPFENSNKLSEYNIIIDAIFGVGLSKPVTGKYEEIINRMNENQGMVYSVDIPSGVSAEDGAILNVAVRADITVTFGLNKIGLLLYPGAEYAGEVIVKDIGFPEEATMHSRPNTFYYEPKDLSLLPIRRSHSHKGTYGKVLIIAGSKGMAGAACLSAKAAYRSGAGLVKVLTSECNRIILQSQLPEALFGAYDEVDIDLDQKQQQLLRDLEWATVIVVGPGLGLSKTSAELVETVIRKAKVPIIIDADAITLISNKLNEQGASPSPDMLKNRLNRLAELIPEGTIFTPHPVELSRLLGVPVTDITNNLIDTAHQCSYNNKLIYALKDARTIVTHKDRYYINLSGNHGMATGGSGDVLTGIIAALVAQGMESYEAVCLAVYIHGLAGDEAAMEKSSYAMMASDIVSSIEKVFINYEKTQK